MLRQLELIADMNVSEIDAVDHLCIFPRQTHLELVVLRVGIPRGMVLAVFVGPLLTCGGSFVRMPSHLPGYLKTYANDMPLLGMEGSPFRVIAAYPVSPPSPLNF